MNNYKLKPEACKFFKDKLATEIHDLEDWQKYYGVDEKALDKVEPPYISYGHPLGENSQSLSGWGQENGGHFRFTIYFPSVKFMEFDKFSKGQVTRKLMDRIQNQINSFYRDYLEDETLSKENQR